MGNKVDLPSPPCRMVSLVPSQTELLFDLGLDDRVVGITKFCVHPELWRKSKIIVGGTKNFDFNAIERLRPDLIIGNKEENYPEGISKLRELAPVWMSDISSFEDALEMIQSVSRLTDREKPGKEVIFRIRKAFENLRQRPAIRALYLMWREPWMGAAGKTFIHAMMEKAGFVNVLDEEERYPQLSETKMRELDLEVILLSSEPYPFEEKHIEELLRILPRKKVCLVDGEMFSWYGSRLALMPAYFDSLTKKLDYLRSGNQKLRHQDKEDI
jgi:ABC-type Fe3+-hydroxamate transport system substrate-binding protein